MVRSPCIQRCMLDESFTYCIGCYRSREAIAAWSRATDQQKRAFLKEAKQFKRAAKAGQCGGPGSRGSNASS